jgi:ketosteroid isomerase-like protein
MADDMTYFDPVQEQRVNGLEAMRTLLAPFAGRIHIDRYEMINPRVQQVGDVATLTFNLVNYLKPPSGPERVVNRWNSTEMYRRTNGTWKLIHSHWSYVKPDVKLPAP